MVVVVFIVVVVGVVLTLTLAIIYIGGDASSVSGGDIGDDWGCLWWWWRNYGSGGDCSWLMVLAAGPEGISFGV